MIEAIQIEQIAAIVRRAGLNAPMLAALREQFSPLHFSTCLDDELGADEPFLTDEHFNLYLVDGRAHCLTLTGDLACATGVLLAEVSAHA
ncbi:hypothetical protein SAMN05421644_12520 [Allochromatium warmingii]|uniref:DUF6129 domain-containing protein n=1 Tax=Allochromatium warmingii TaxID=61595 RepID=A0A1H3GJG7_ALLWA|nr:DUF6129 family protein [Allochromatium warmingii]SDY03200.1 hypothetical protein SAMN05421644_12520 [Allochromatium warmingii]